MPRNHLLIAQLRRGAILEEVFRTTQGDEKARRETDKHVWDYLRIEFLTEEDLKDHGYTDIREKDIKEMGIPMK